MDRKVKIKCRYYRVEEMINGACTENIYDLCPWIAKVLGIELQERYKDINNTK